jgi:hypothetical protein
MTLMSVMRGDVEVGKANDLMSACVVAESDALQRNRIGTYAVKRETTEATVMVRRFRDGLHAWVTHDPDSPETTDPALLDKMDRMFDAPVEEVG